jgi:hypothetical protein
MAVAFLLAAIGTLLLSGVDANGSYLADVMPGLIVAGLGLGIALVSVTLSVLTGAPERETGMLSGLNTTGHEIGGSLGIAVLVSIATSSLAGAATPAALASGIGNAFLAASIIATVAAIVAPALLPSAASFLPKLRMAPPIAVH